MIYVVDLPYEIHICSKSFKVQASHIFLKHSQYCDMKIMIESWLLDLQQGQHYLVESSMPTLNSGK